MALVITKKRITLNNRNSVLKNYKKNLKRAVTATYFDTHPGTLMADNDHIFGRSTIKQNTRNRKSISTLLHIKKEKQSNIHNYRFNRSGKITISCFKEK